MSPDYKDQLNRLRKVAPTIEAVYEALKQPQLDVGVVWAYFYPISLQQAYTFFGGERNEEVANNAAFALMEHLVGERKAILDWEGRSKLSPFYDVVAHNFFQNYMEREVKKEPPIFYGHLEGMEMEVAQFNEDYPYDGIEEEFVAALVKEEEKRERIRELMEDLFPAERRVLELLVQELTYPEIRAELGISEGALKQSITRIRSTLNAG